ncbi:peptidase M61 [Asticcacaulis sp. 201]|uniref:M61 family metallopeptidase n=1 Tax=Asticcacaulis sp. 201 TaxID=3028787 RepID=UPI002915F5D6|nr:peptidase M61 [Asticcacaulis sp. 201]MDV6333189.1 peptidase M61 [Asticcacaulis sp. 201]
MKTVSGLALAGAVLMAGAVQAAEPSQPLPMPAADTPSLPVPQDVDYPGIIQLHVDATDMDHHVIAIHEVIPVAGSGRLTLLTPKWLPGHHSPGDSDLTKLAGLHVFANGKEIAWRRDPVAMNAFHVEVPEGVSEVVADFQYLSPVTSREGVIVHTRNMLTLQWENESLYPAGYYTRRIPIQAHVTLPAGWQYGSALEAEKRDGDVVTFKPISYDNFIDSPLIAGRYFKRYDMDPGSRTPVSMDLVADDPKELEVSDAVLKIHRKVVQEAYKLFGGWHYDHYNWLVAVSNEMGGIGLEHHRSSEIGIEPGYFASTAGKGFGRNIIAHEYIHSWDGKFRRPAGQFTATFDEPMRDELLWVYEGGTTYWTDVLESRAGLYTFDQRLQMLAVTAATYDILPARQWRDLEDTTYDPIISNRGPKGWPSWQRSEDYYAEGGLMWLDADTLIRDKTQGRKSLDDFARAFFGTHNGSYLPAPYTFDDVVRTLNDVYPYDWANFLTTRITRTGGGAPIDGLARAGYRLVYDDTPNDFIKSNEARRGIGFGFSLGLAISKDGTLRDVLWNGPGFKAGLAPGMKVLAVNGRAFDAARLKDAIVAAHKAGNTDIIEMMLQDGEYFRTVRFDYHDGLRYPHLERIDGVADLLKPIYGFEEKTVKARN